MRFNHTQPGRMKFNGTIILFLGFLLVQGVFSLGIAEATDMNEYSLIEPNECSYFQLSVDANEPLHVNITSNSSIDILLMDQVNFGRFLQHQSHLVYVNLSSINIYEDVWTPQSLHEDFGVPYAEPENEQVSKKFYVVIVNHDESDAGVYFRVNYNSQSMHDFADVARIIMFFCVVVIAFFLLLKSYQYRREQEEIKSGMLFNYGIGMTFTAGNIMIFEIEHWSITDSGKPWLPEFSTYSQLLGMDLPISYLISAIGLGIVIYFMVYGLEKNAIGADKPYRSIFIIITAILMIPSIFFPVLVDVTIILYALSMIVGFGLFLRLFLQLIAQSSGVVRRKAIMILVGLILFVLTNFHRGINGDARDLGYMVTNILTILALVMFYYGVI